MSSRRSYKNKIQVSECEYRPACRRTASSLPPDIRGYFRLVSTKPVSAINWKAMPNNTRICAS